jgi:predicted small lipoprotein YifL
MMLLFREGRRVTSKTCTRPDVTLGAVLAATIAALSLAGCGRVGPLYLPPGVTTDLAPNGARAKPAPPPPGGNVAGTTETPLFGSAPAATEPTAAPGQKRPLPILDWLLN